MSQNDLKPAKEMEIHELEQFLKIESSQQSSVSMAMKALQEKIKILESEKKPDEPKNISDQELKLCKQKIVRLEDQVKFLEDQCNFARAETKRTNDQYEIDKENWALQFEHMKRQLQKGGGEGLKIEKRENNKYKTIIKEMQAQIDGLNSEILGLRKNYENLKNSSGKKIQGLEAEIEKLKKKDTESLKIIESKNKIIDNLNFKLKNAENKNLFDKKSLKKGKNSGVLQSPLRKSRSNSVKNSASNSIILETSNFEKEPLPFSERNPKNIVGGENTNENLIKEISEVEKRILELGSKYKTLLQSSQSASEISSIRTEMQNITQKMEEENNYLYNLKKKHQDSIRETIKNLENLKYV